MALKDRLKTMGFMPDMGKLTDMFDQKFGELIQHIDNGFAQVVAAIREQKGVQQ